MTLSDTSLRIALGTRIVPTAGDISGDIHLGRDITIPFPVATVAWRARIISNGGSVSGNWGDGTLVADSAPVHQVETATVVAAAGATSSGNLALTVTGAAITGSPLAVSVPLVTGTHTTAALIAAACRTALAATAAVAAQYTVGGTGATITLTRPPHLPGSNDATLNIAIAAGLGVTAAASSANTTAGVAGATIERLGGSGEDINGVALPACTTAHCLAFFPDATNSPGTPMGCSIYMDAYMFYPGYPVIVSGMGVIGTKSMSITGTGILDIIFIGK